MKKVLALLGSICLLLFVYAGIGGVQAAETFGMTFGGYSIGGYTSEEKQKTVTATITDENTVKMECPTEISAVYFGVAATDLTIASPSAITVVKAENEQKIACEAEVVSLYEELWELHQNENGQTIGIWIKDSLTEGTYTITIPENSVKSKENGNGNEEFRIILHVNNEAGAKCEKGILSWDKVEGAKYYRPIIFADSIEGLKYSNGGNGRQLTIGMAALDGGWGKESIFLEKENRIIMDFVNGCEILVDGHTYIYEILAYNEEEELIASQEAKCTYFEPENKLYLENGGEWDESEDGEIFHYREDAKGRPWLYTYRYLYYCEPGGTEFTLLTRKGGLLNREYNITSSMTKAGTYKVRMIVGNQEGFSDFSDYSEEYVVTQEKEEANLIKKLDAVNPSKLKEKEVNQIVDVLRNSTKEALERIFASSERKDKIAEIEERYLSFHDSISSETKAEISAQVQEKVSEIKGIGISFNIQSEAGETVRLKAELTAENAQKKVDTEKYKENSVQIDLTLSGIGNHEIVIPIIIEMDLPVGLSLDGLRVLHYLEGDSYQEIIPVISGSKIIFPVSHFSTFVFVNAKSTSSSSGTSSSGGNRHSSSTAVLTKNQWEASAGIWKYRKADGTYAKSEWQQIDGKWYYFDADAVMDIGWQLVNGKWYYMDKQNGDMKTDWQQINGKWYYLKPQNGDMQMGWLYWNQKWFYLKKEGDMAIGWQQIGGKWYYMTTYGDCLIHTITPDGYQVDENGVWMQ